MVSRLIFYMDLELFLSTIQLSKLNFTLIYSLKKKFEIRNNQSVYGLV